MKSTVTRSFIVEEVPEIPGLPPVKGRVSVTLNRVKDPQLHDPSLPPEPNPDDSEERARLDQIREEYREIEPVFISAQVYDHNRTFISWRSARHPDVFMSAWSNLDFNHFSGFATYRIRGTDGRVTTYRLVMGIGNLDTARLQQIAASQGRNYQAPVPPELPPLASGPAFVVLSGDPSNHEANRIVEGLHELYRAEGERMKQAYEGRERAQQDRRAYLLANPPRPKDVTIHYWKRENAVGETQNQEGPAGE